MKSMRPSVWCPLSDEETVDIYILY
jgi:hypothetical protein